MKDSKHYADKRVVADYDRERFGGLAGKLYHAFEVREVKRVFSERKPKRVLSAPVGTGRVEAELPLVEYQAGVDSSREMIRYCDKRLPREWHLFNCDLFKMPVELSRFDLILCFRFIRHFPREQRKKVFAALHKRLARGGVLVFDAWAWACRNDGEDYNEGWTRELLERELLENGFELVSFRGRGRIQYFWRTGFFDPLHYVVEALKK